MSIRSYPRPQRGLGTDGAPWTVVLQCVRMSEPVSASHRAPFAAAGGRPSALRLTARRAWLAISSALAAILGLAPHVLHHAGPLAGAALFAGVAGSLIFGALGFVLAIPFMLRMRRRFGSWRVPLAALALYTTAFSISTFIVGPAVTGNGNDATSRVAQPQGPGQPASEPEHEAHHP